MIPRGSPEHVRSQVLRSKANARRSKRNVLQTPFWGYGWSYEDPQHGTQENHDYYARMQRDVPTLWGSAGEDIEVCGYFGHWDACGKQSVIRQWQNALPRMAANCFEFPEIGHFIEEYKGPEMAASILAMNQIAD